MITLVATIKVQETMKAIFPYLDGKPQIDTFQEVSRIHKAK